MDPVTHALLGATVGYSIGGRVLGRHAAGLGALAGITPDIDHFIRSSQDPLLYVEFHRGFTHSLAFSFVGALFPMIPWLLRLEWRSRFGMLWLCAWPAYLSHCLLDAATTWGTQLFWPFSSERAGWDFIAIVDPLFTLPLAALLIAAVWRRSRTFVAAGLVFAFAYLGFGAVQRSRAQSIQEQLAAARGHTMERAEVMPTLANNVIWRSLYLAHGRIHADRIRVGWFSPGTVREGTSLLLIRADDLTEAESAANRQHGAFDRFAWFSDGWVARAPADPGILGDMRYSRSTEAFDPIWGIRFLTNEVPPLVEWVSRERDRQLGAGDLWAEIAGRDPRYSVPAAKPGR